MKITLRFETANEQHTTMRVFINGTSAGLLTMGTKEAGDFHQIVAHGCAKGIDTFLSTGESYALAPDTDAEKADAAKDEDARRDEKPGSREEPS